MLTAERAETLQKILSKRMGRALSDSELESAYKALVEFAIALIDLVPDDKATRNVKESQNHRLPLAIRA